MKYIVIGDVHLGHAKTPTAHIVSSLRKHILSDKHTDIDVLFIEGDLFDRLLDLNSKEVQVIISFFDSLLNYCFLNNIKLRVLEGTPSHDVLQPEILVKLNEIRDNKVDLKYFKVLDIEYLAEENKYVLYIPDEWVNDHAVLEKQIKDKLNLLGIEQVDIAILHGQFGYQVQGIPYTGFRFDEVYFLNIVKDLIHVGHYHTYSYFERIVATGSFERLAHGEEEPKGYLVAKDRTYTFIPNTDAYIYKNITLRSNTTLEQLDRNIRQYPKDSHICLTMSKDHSFNLTFGELKLRYLDYNLKKKIKDESEQNQTTYIQTDAFLDLSNKFTIDSDVQAIVLRNIQEQITLSESETVKLKGYLSVFKNTINQETNI